MPQLRDDSRRVLEKNYPESEYLTKGYKSDPARAWWKIW